MQTIFRNRWRGRWEGVYRASTMDNNLVVNHRQLCHNRHSPTDKKNPPSDTISCISGPVSVFRGVFPAGVMSRWVYFQHLQQSFNSWRYLIQLIKGLGVKGRGAFALWIGGRTLTLKVQQGHGYKDESDPGGRRGQTRGPQNIICAFNTKYLCGWNTISLSISQPIDVPELVVRWETTGGPRCRWSFQYHSFILLV